MSKTGWIERMASLKNCLMCSYSTPVVVFSPQDFFVQCISLLCTNTCKSLHTQVFCEYLPHHTCVDCLSHVDNLFGFVALHVICTVD